MIALGVLVRALAMAVPMAVGGAFGWLLAGEDGASVGVFVGSLLLLAWLVRDSRSDLGE